MFPGQGAQFPGMAAGLYDVNGPFTVVMDRVFDLLGVHGRRLRRIWLSGKDIDGFDDASVAQPLLFGTNCASAASLIARGLQPTVLIGHSVGEVAAAHVAGVFDLETGLSWIDRLIAWSARVPAGGMLAVAASVDDVAPHLRGSVVVGAVNARRQLLLAGADRDLDDVRAALTDAGFTSFRARARQPFHSPAMWIPDVPPLARATLHAPRTRLWSCYAQQPLDDGRARDPSFWAGQPAEPVYFGPTLDRLLDTDGPIHLVEAGPGSSLCGIARRTRQVAHGFSAATAALPGPDAAANRAAQDAVVEQLAAGLAR
ncbi:hypothetical protein AFB00_31140 (plasmid) [Pseudonocardia sp. HH130630-07]|nr:hypothetical protein AFB00_31140 [Pseudonocardia sp. HH130630-07]